LDNNKMQENKWTLGCDESNCWKRIQLDSLFPPIQNAL
jgi:hypothetical protein